MSHTSICVSQFRRAARIGLLPVLRSPPPLPRAAALRERRALRLLQWALHSHTLLFSHTHDVTQSAQRCAALAQRDHCSNDAPDASSGSSKGGGNANGGGGSGSDGNGDGEWQVAVGGRACSDGSAAPSWRQADSRLAMQDHCRHLWVCANSAVPVAPPHDRGVCVNWGLALTVSLKHFLEGFRVFKS